MTTSKYILGLIITLLGAGYLGAQSLDPAVLLDEQANNQNVHQSAVNFYTRLIEQDPDDTKSLIKRSQLLRAMNMPLEAEADHELALTINPYSYLHLGKDSRNSFFAKRSYGHKYNNDDGNKSSLNKSFLLEEEYDRVLYLNDLTLESVILIEEALIDIYNDDHKAAQLKLDALAEEEKKTSLFYDVQGVIYLEQGELDKGIAMFDKAIEIDNNFTVAYHNRAVAHKLNGNLQKSEEDFKTALAQRADIAKIKFSKASLFEKKGNNEKAKAYYKEAIKTESNYIQARLNYSVLLKAAGEYTSSMIEINNLIDENPEDIDYLYVRGGLYFIYGEYSDAIKDFSSYLSVNPEDTDVRFYKGLCLIMDGQKELGCSDIYTTIENNNLTYQDVYQHMCE